MSPTKVRFQLEGITDISFRETVQYNLRKRIYKTQIVKSNRNLTFTFKFYILLFLFCFWKNLHIGN